MTNPEPVDTALRIHAALTDWTGKVDTKASFALTIESAVIVGVVALAADGRRFGEMHNGWVGTFLFIGLILMLVAVCSAGSVVLLRICRKDVKDEWGDNFIYFGHLQYWKPGSW